MSEQLITPESYLSDSPPERYMGCEGEYTLQYPPGIDPEGNSISPGKFLSEKAFKAAGLKVFHSFISNGANASPAGQHIEYRTPECFGAHEMTRADLAGTRVLARVIEASGLPYYALYRTAGTYFQNSIDEITSTPGNTSGFHDNYLINGREAGRQIFEWLIPAFLASNIWARQGTITDQYVFSQKVGGIGEEPVERTLVDRRTVHGRKPMCIILNGSNDSDILGDSQWARLEVRHADAPQSYKALYLGRAAMSLVIRMAEHNRKLDSKKLENLQLRYPVSAAHMFARDLTFRQTTSTINNGEQTWLNLQEQYALLAIDLASKIELPPSELQALDMWLDLIDRLRLCNPVECDYGNLIYELDIAAMHYYLSSVMTPDKMNIDNPDAVAIALMWDSVLPDGGAKKWFAKFGSPLVKDSDIENLTVNPPRGRATSRVNVMSDPSLVITGLNYASYSKPGGETFKFPL